ncbi:uncharacterized protein EMH_0031350 [Eimeria mitis]|uniref:DNA cross-link repair protein n=1 Tax=Eimeria mitis TaxID=44415 RepID=U6KKU2_9EIME|nr:uncharacterized protein EMH_0031350 [Eimeria mitis]CDJ36078.1 hypothetical protein, conserved [Eimeria mitis]
MPLSAPLEALNVFVDFFGQSKGGHQGPPRAAGGLHGPSSPRLWCQAASIGGPEVTWGATPSRGKGPLEEGPLQEGSLEEWPCLDGSPAFGCGFCVPSLFVLTHAHSDHMRGLRPSWGKDKFGASLASRGPSGGPPGPIVCTEMTRQLLLRMYPQLEPYLLPLQLQTPYLFYVHRVSIDAPVGHLSEPPGKPDPSEQHTPRGPQLLCGKAEKATEGGGGHVGPSEIAIQPNECKELQAAHTENSGSKRSSTGKQQTWPQLLVERAAAAVRRSSSSSSPGGGGVCCCGRAVDRVYIQLVDARHCPGSALLLLRSPVVGSYVHTGDFCCSGTNLQPLLQEVQKGLQLLQELEDPAAAAATAAATPEQANDEANTGSNAAEGAETSEGLMSQQQQQRQLHVDVLYLDSTYLHPRFSFLSQEEAVAEMSLKVKAAAKRIRGNAMTRGSRGPSEVHSEGSAGLPPSSLHVVVGVDKLGKESLLQQLATALKIPIGLSEAHFDSAAAATAAGYNDCCAYTTEAFTRGFCCPVVRGATDHRTASSNSSSSNSSNSSNSSSNRTNACRKFSACGCPWGEETSVWFPSSPLRQKKQPLHQQDQLEQFNQEEEEEPFDLGQAASATDAAVSLFAVPRRQLVKVVEALEASGLPTLGLLPSVCYALIVVVCIGGGLSFGAHSSIQSIPMSSHSSFSSLLEFVKALSPQKAVLLEPLPIPSCGCAALRRPSSEQGHRVGDLTSSSSSKSSSSSWGSSQRQNLTDEVRGFMVEAPESRDLRNPQSGDNKGILDEPVALLLDDPEALDTIVSVRAQGLDCIETSSSSSHIALSTLYKGSSTSTAGVAARAASRRPADVIDSCKIYGAFKYNGIEGLSVFVRTTEVPIVVLGSGRRPFCPHGGPCRGSGDPSPTMGAIGGAPEDRSRALLFSVQPKRLKRGAPSLPAVCTRHSEGPARFLHAPDAQTNSALEGSVMPLKKVNRKGAVLRFALPK